MASLGDHLRQSGSHGSLPFHWDCPICREERVSGNVPTDRLVGPRGQAGLLAAALATSTFAVPSVALADHGGGNAPAAHAAQAPDGELDGIDGDDGTQQDTLAAEDDALVDGGNLIEPDAQGGQEDPPASPLSGLAPEQAGEETELMAAPEAEPDASAPATPEPPASTVPPSAPPPPPVTVLSDRDAGSDVGFEPPHLRLERQRSRTASLQRATATPITSIAESRSRGARLATPATSATVTSVVRGNGHVAGQEALRGGDGYTVVPGDSLWSIARRLLGRDASVANVADEVNRLWQLNRARIATGDPDLLPIGTELRL